MAGTDDEREKRGIAFLATGDRGARVARIDEKQRLAIMRRLDAGESQSALAREFGCSRQYVSQLRKRFAKFGERGIEQRPRGRPKARPLTPPLRLAVRAAIDTSSPSDHGLVPHHVAGDVWHIDAVREFVKDREGWTPTRGQIIGLFEEWELTRDHFKTRHRETHVDEPDPEFEAWQRSPIARQIREREEAMARQTDREQHAGQIEFFDDADFEAFRQKFAASQLGAPAPMTPMTTPPAGVRTGKHAKAKAAKPAAKRRKPGRHRKAKRK